MRAESLHEYIERLEKKCDEQASALAKAERENDLFRAMMSILALPSDPVESTIPWLQVFLHDLSIALGFQNWRDFLNQMKSDSEIIPQFKAQVCSLFGINPQTPDEQVIAGLRKTNSQGGSAANDDFAITLAALLEMNNANRSEILQKVLEFQRMA
jgi:hypothetical protein